jgi:hypothetical protein
MAKLLTPAQPRMPVAPVEYSQRYGDDLTNVLRLYFTQLQNVFSAITGNEGGQYLSFPYGSFLDTTTQTAAVINTAYPIKFNTTSLSNSVVVQNDGSSNPTKLVVDETGVYNFAFSLQLQKASASKKDVWLWPRINGVDVPNSATKVSLAGSSAASVAAWNFFLNLTSKDYVQLMWAVEDTGIQILYEAATAFAPAIPSVILTANFISLPPTNSSI